MGIKRVVPLIIISLFIFSLAFAQTAQKQTKPPATTVSKTITPAKIETVKVYVLDPDSSKELAKLKSEYYDRELARFEREMHNGEWRITLFQWLLGFMVAFASVFAVYWTSKSRSEAREDLKAASEVTDRELASLRKEAERMFDRVQR